MTGPYTLCALAVATAVVAAGIGWRLRATAREQRRTRKDIRNARSNALHALRVAQELRAAKLRLARLEVAGRLAVTSAWDDFIAEHAELTTHPQRGS